MLNLISLNFLSVSNEWNAGRAKLFAREKVVPIPSTSLIDTCPWISTVLYTNIERQVAARRQVQLRGSLYQFDVYLAAGDLCQSMNNQEQSRDSNCDSGIIMALRILQLIKLTLIIINNSIILTIFCYKKKIVILKCLSLDFNLIFNWKILLFS